MSTEKFIDFIGNYSIAMIVALFVAFSLAEMAAPLRNNRQRIASRWFTNLTLTAVIVLVLRLLAPLSAMATAVSTEYLGFGLLNNAGLALPLSLLIGIAILDLKQYWFHRLMHYFDTLWRIHRVHHSDLELDLTTGFRFHPAEAILNALVDILVVAVFGIPVAVIALRYLLVYFANLFSHANIRLPPAFDRCLRWVLVTPSMHHLHHAMDMRAANSNFGVLFSIWDRIFGSYIDRHPGGERPGSETTYTLGLREYREPAKLTLATLMGMPLQRAPADPGETSIESQGR